MGGVLPLAAEGEAGPESGAPHGLFPGMGFRGDAKRKIGATGRAGLAATGRKNKKNGPEQPSVYDIMLVQNADGA